MTRERIQIHSRHLPGTHACDLAPLPSAEPEGGQHLERHVRHVRTIACLECLELLYYRRQQFLSDVASHQVAKQRFTLAVARLRVHHPEHVHNRRRAPDRRGKQRRVGPLVQPATHAPLGRRSERPAAGCARADDLHERPKYSRRIDDAIEDAVHQCRILSRQHRQQQRRHVLHVAALAAVHRRFRDELGGHPCAQRQNGIELLFGTRVKRVVQAAGRRQLRERVLRRQPIRRGAFLVVRIGLRQQCPHERTT